MSERSPDRNEQQESAHDLHELQSRSKENLLKAQELAKNAENEHAKNIENLRDLVKNEAVDSRNSASREHTNRAEPEEANTYWYSREYRELAFRQLLNNVRKSLSPTDRAASKLIHRPMVEKASEIGEKTIGRTSGVLTGSIFSFLASITTYYFSRRNGYDMTYSIFILSFIGGFIIGVIVEFIVKALRSLLSRH